MGRDTHVQVSHHYYTFLENMKPDNSRDRENMKYTHDVKGQCVRQYITHTFHIQTKKNT